MKHLLIGIVFLSMATAVFGTTWYQTNQKTIVWDEVTTLDGTVQIPEGSTIEYRIYTKESPDGEEVYVDQTSDTSYTVTFSEEGKFRVGVRSVRVVNSSVVSQSDIAWSSDASACQDGVDFGILNYLKPAQTKGLRSQ